MWVPTQSKENQITAAIPKKPVTVEPKPFIQTLAAIDTPDKPMSTDDTNADPPSPVDPKRVQAPVAENIGPQPDDDDDTWESAHWCA